MIFGGGSTQSQQPEQIKAIRVQTSAYGVVRPLVYGTTRITGNLIYYTDFTAIANTTDMGGK